jgi:hypothetical protein
MKVVMKVRITMIIIIMDLGLDLTREIRPSINEHNPAAHAESIGTASVKLLKRVSPPRWSNTLTIRKKKATKRTKSKNNETDHVPDFDFGKKLIFICFTSL